MKRIIKDREFESVTRAPALKRYKHFVGQTVGWEAVWALRNGNEWRRIVDDDGKEYFPFWPHEAYAAACAIGEWVDDVAAPIEVHEFIDVWLPNLIAEDVRLSVFPTPDGSSTSVNPSRLLADMSEELARYE